MTKLVLSSSALAIVLAMPAVAAAQAAPSGSCPPGSWFCAPPAPEPAPPAAQPTAPPLPDPDEAPPPPPPPRRRPPVVTYQPAPPPPVVVYQPPPPTMIVRPENPPPYDYAPPPPPPRRPLVKRSEWGINLHLEGVSMGGGYEHNAGMGGLGGGLRFKPNPYFGLETDLDFVGGHGYQGDQRHEEALSFNALMFLNPRSKAQVYLLGGFGWGWANSQPDPSTDPTASYNNNYTYFGAQAGIGLELRLTRVLAFNADFRGIIRTCTNCASTNGGNGVNGSPVASNGPEFTNPTTGQQTNTSGGALFTGGMTLYF